MKISHAYWCFKKPSNQQHRKTSTLTVVLLILFCIFSPAQAALITINAAAPSQTQLDLQGITSSEASDFCIGATGDDMNSNGLGSGIVDDYAILPDGSFVSSQNVSRAGLGLTSSGIGGSGLDLVPDSPLNNPEAICFEFPQDPVYPDELFSAVIDVNYLEDSDVEESTILALSGLDTSDCFFSYHDYDNINDTLLGYVPASCGVTLAPPSMIFAGAAEARLIEATIDARRFRLVSSPSTSALAYLCLGIIFFARTIKH